MTYTIKNCETCQQPFKAERRYLSRGHARFCSISCSSRRKQHKDPNVQCAYCQTLFYKNPSKRKASKSGLFFCCREHKDAAQQIGGIKEIMPPHYGVGNGIHQYRKNALAHYPNKCSKCSYNRFTEALVVHHKDNNRTNNKLDNLQVLCPTCHWEIHLGLV